MSIRTLALRAAKTWMTSRPPDFEIGPPEDRYLRHWIVGPWGRYERGTAPKNWWDGFKRRLPNLYLHQIRRDDEDRALHDHPWASCSWLLENGYREVLFYPMSEERIDRLRRDGEPRPIWEVSRPEGAVVFRRATTAHRLVLEKVPARLGRTENVEVVSAFFTGFSVRVWGFHCRKRWVPWQEFVGERDKGTVGAGCGD